MPSQSSHRSQMLVDQHLAEMVMSDPLWKIIRTDMCPVYMVGYWQGSQGADCFFLYVIIDFGLILMFMSAADALRRQWGKGWWTNMNLFFGGAIVHRRARKHRKGKDTGHSPENLHRTYHRPQPGWFRKENCGIRYENIWDMSSIFQTPQL